MILKDYLMSLGYHIVGEAKRGRDSLQMFRDLKPDLIVLGAAMPDMDGVSVVRELVREDTDAVIIICVARGQRALAVEALGAGAREFITKPIDMRHLRRVLSQASQPPKTF